MLVFKNVAFTLCIIMTILSAIPQEVTATHGTVVTKIVTKPARKIFKAVGGGYKAVVKEMPYSSALGDTWDSWWGATDTGRTKWVVSTLQILKGGKEIFVYRSAYSDLSQVSGLTINTTSKGCILQIEGGDDHSGYSANLVVKDLTVKSRHVEAGESPELSHEDASYVDKEPPPEDN